MRHLATINKYFLKYKWRFLFGIVFVFLTNYFRILAPQLTGHILNTVVNAINGKANLAASKDISNYDLLVRIIIEQFSSASFSQQILYTGFVLIIIAVISGIFMFLMRQTIIVMSRHIEFDQKNEVYAHYQKLDLGFFKMNKTGDLMNRISEDISRVRMYTGPAIMYFINLAAIIGFSIYFMVKSDVKLTIVALCPLPILAVTIYLVNTIIHKKSERIQSLLSDLTTSAQESYSGIRVIKAFVQEQNMFQYFQRKSEDYRDSALSLAKTEAIYFPSMGLMIGLSTIITILIGGLDVVNNVPGSSIGKIAEFVLYIQMLTFPVSAIGWTASMTQRAATSQERINEFLLQRSKIETKENAKDVDFKGNLNFNQVDFYYPDTGIHALKKFNLRIKEGQKVAIIGKTGSGKTTIAQLILRMYDISAGSLQIEGVELKNLNLPQYRNQISYVPQDIFLFSDTIANNIRFGDATATQQQVEDAARKAGIFYEITAFEKGFETLVGERGVTLSGGQKQRISIARALLKQPGLLILDDCLSAVDVHTEKLIVGNLNHYLENRSALIITHRIFSSFRFDKIVVLEDGAVIEEGTQEELILKDGHFAEMYRKQLKQEEVQQN
jgi:ATP-binding cassette subfamily B protein